MKVLIIGSVGSGKSTYSKKISDMSGIERYEIDSIVHDDINDSKRNEHEIKKILDDINSKDEWIIEGVLRKNLEFLLDYSDKIILLDTKYKTRKRRIIKRYIKQKLRIEKCNYKPSIKLLKQMLIWNKRFEYNKKSLMIKLDKYYDKLQIV